VLLDGACRLRRVALTNQLRQETSVTQPSHGQLLIRLEVLVNLTADRSGLLLDHKGRLTDADAQLVADALDLQGEAHSARGQAAVELLRVLAEAVGLLRDRGDHLEATILRHSWAQLDPDLRAGLVYAAWVHRSPWDQMLGDVPDPLVKVLRERRGQVLRLLYELPAEVEVRLDDLGAAVCDRLGVPGQHELGHVVLAVFLDPLVALDAAEIDPPSPGDPHTVRLRARARKIISSALIAAGQDVPPATRP
jgi:hypothetical protein